MRLLWFSLATDANNPWLGFNVRWVEAVAKHVESIHVISMTVGEYDLPDNVYVHSVGKEKGYGEPRRAVVFYKLLFDILRNQRIDVCFSHMIPLFSVMAAPVLKLKRIPIVTWYAHPSLTTVLKAAHFASDRMIASVPSAYPYRQDKLVAVGQGIDTDLFSPVTINGVPTTPLILCAGRLSPAKGHPILIDALKILRDRDSGPFKAVIIGGPAKLSDHDYKADLEHQIQRHGLNGIVEFIGSVKQDQLVDWYNRCTVHVNLTPTGFGDKVAWESMSCGKVCLASNNGFKDTFGDYADALLYPHGDARALADGLDAFLSMASGERERIGLYLRQQVIDNHSLTRLSTTLVQLFTDTIRGKSV